MRPTLAVRSMTFAVLAAGLVIPTGVRAQAATSKPLLSEEIAKVIDQDGVEAGQSRFDQLYPAQKDNYELDVPGFFALAAKYMQGGNTAAGQQVMAMAATVAQAGMAASMGMATPDPGPEGTGTGQNGASAPEAGPPGHAA